MSTLLTKFLPEVLPYCLGVPEPIAINAIRNALIEFCEKTHWVIEEVDAVYTAAGIGSYSPTTSPATTAVRVVDAWLDSSRLVAKGMDELRDMFPTDWREQTGSPRYFTQLDSCEVRLCPTPEVGASVLQLIVATQPTRTANACEDSLYERWLEVIAYGARARICDTPGQPYSNAATALAYAGRFARGVAVAKAERNRGLTRAQLHVRMPRAI